MEKDRIENRIWDQLQKMADLIDWRKLVIIITRIWDRIHLIERVVKEFAKYFFSGETHSFLSLSFCFFRNVVNHCA
jgi:hypothetical protein